MLEFEVSDMTCGHCAGVITNAVSAVAPAAEVKIDLPAHRVQVMGASNADAVENAIRDAGYAPVRNG
ncbi:copper chaperone [Candidimonas sp. SYP-B2681]|uniref:heavy-metal-associated domain-containing protein n=1 Tax=Candidimonas sp. SYP-B2681 TaxID=2497686 RepID=UPI000F899F42|nr:heavy-metal-associated domain-containing protein [Candidimonas sp. SYP-B2681]RTZ47988.1 copper chaperone [Candidimonas sp. SYP-B2681]